MNQLPALIQREFWENWNIFVALPLVVTGLFLLVMLFSFFAMSGENITMRIQFDDVQFDDIQFDDIQFDDIQFNDKGGDRMAHHLESDDLADAVVHYLGAMNEGRRARLMSQAMRATSIPLAAVLWLVVAFYLLDCLYADRKDRSVLFWKSLPVPDSLTVVSKLVVGLLCVPAVYVGMVAVTHLFALSLLTLGTFGTAVSAWSAVWAPAALPLVWAELAGLVLLQAFWCLPLYGWLLLVSSHVKSAPLVWALGVPVAAVIAERVVAGQARFGRWVTEHVAAVPGGDMPIVDFLGEKAFSWDMGLAVAVGIVLVALAIWRRGKAGEI